MRRVDVITGSRLHFGLYRIGATESGQFGGIGAMVRCCPSWVQVAASCGTTSVLPPASHVQQVWKRFCARFDQARTRPVTITIRRRAPQHQGLGSGTQLALSAAAALDAYFETGLSSAELIAAIAGRGERSGIGSHGFFRGGFLADRGRSECGATIPHLQHRLAMPDAWRSVLIEPLAFDRNVSGETETQFFASSSSDEARARTLQAIAEEEIRPAILRADYTGFAKALGTFNELSGMQFAAFQGGPFNGPIVSELVQRIRKFGWQGVGQSSWGPTVFVVTPSQVDAEDLVNKIESFYPSGALRTRITRFQHAAATIRVRTSKSG